MDLSYRMPIKRAKDREAYLLTDSLNALHKTPLGIGIREIQDMLNSPDLTDTAEGGELGDGMVNRAKEE